MKKKTKGMPKVRAQKTVKGGLKGLAESFVNVGIPTVVETSLNTKYRGISARLIESGNRPVSLKIKL